MSQVRHSALNFIKKENPTQVFPCEYCKTSENNFFYRTPPVATSKVLPNHCCVNVNGTYTPTVRHRKVIVLSLQIGKNSTLKSMTTIFLQGVLFVRHHFFGLLYFSVSSGVFVMCHFCKVQFFSNSIKECLFCWVYLSDPAVVFVFVIAMWIMKVP